MARRFAPATSLVLEILRPALAPVEAYSLMPDLTLNPPPVVMARRVPGGGAYDPRGYDQAVIDVQCWHTTDRAADDLADACRAALFTAWRTQHVVPGMGHIGHYEERSAPALLPDSVSGRGSTTPKGVYRYQATYVLGLRPHRAA
ncbi:hypothetical protein [Nocardiopsis synnemataformans]|uniref:hypothetical protein n=1 Tax=Nocardiopsis synnemataformans TaxID=61305 RepID=UPI003EB9C8DB